VERPAWLTWRVCPGCGCIRTENAESDRSACPRCRAGHIADDGSCLSKVVEPAIASSRDKREDAQIRDDEDDRDQRYYEGPSTCPLGWRRHFFLISLLQGLF
jgi:hypothetical protein